MMYTLLLRPVSSFSVSSGRVVHHQLLSLSSKNRHRLSVRMMQSSNHNNNSNIWYNEALMEHMLHRIKACNSSPANVQLIDFTVNGQILGKCTTKVAQRLCSAGSTFELATGTNHPTLTLSNSAGTTVDQRTKSVSKVMESLASSGYISGWRDELYPVSTNFNSQPSFLVERAAASLLGVIEYGVHINGLVKNDDGETMMWMARRSQTKSAFPGHLDHIVAGGQPAGISLMDNVVKECMEEAGIPQELAANVKPAGAISYENYGGKRSSEGEGVVNRVVLFCFDLELPNSFVPRVVDGEVESFFKWSLEEVALSMNPDYHDPIKPNCYLVIIDYLLRSGAISPDTPKYLEVLRTLRSGSCC